MIASNDILDPPEIVFYTKPEKQPYIPFQDKPRSLGRRNHKNANKILKIFKNFDEIEFPSIDFEIPREKPLKERMIEQKKQLTDPADELYLTDVRRRPFIPDKCFLNYGRKDAKPKNTNWFKGDAFGSKIFLEDYASFTKEVPFVEWEPKAEPGIWRQMKLVAWNQNELEDFKAKSQKLDDFMWRHQIPRQPDAQKRIRKLLSHRSEITRLSAEQVRNANKNDFDLFGYIENYKYTLHKSDRDRFLRRRDVMIRYIDTIYVFDHPISEADKVTKEFNDLMKRREELEDILKNAKCNKAKQSGEHKRRRHHSQKCSKSTCKRRNKNN